MTEVRVDSELTPRQHAFVSEYAKDRNATRAATAAGYSAKTAGQQGSRLLKNVKIRHAVDEIVQEAAEEAKVTVEWVLEHLMQLATDAKSDSARVRALEILLNYFVELQIEELKEQVTELREEAERRRGTYGAVELIPATHAVALCEKVPLSTDSH